MKWLGLVAAAGWLVLAAPALSADPPAPASARAPHARERLREQMRERAAAFASALPSGLALPSAPPPAGSAPPSGIALELARKWRERAADRDARRAKHRALLVQQLGARLTLPAVKAELGLHARRIAELARLEFLAKNARAGEPRERILARVSKLRDTETERHQRALSRLTATPAPAAPSSTPVPPPAVSAGGSN